MWIREDLKMRGKADFKRNYWACVVVSLVLMILLGYGVAGTAGSKARQAVDDRASVAEADYDAERSILSSAKDIVLAQVSFGIAVASFLFVVLFGTFAGNPLIVGGRCFYLQNQRGRGAVGQILHAFDGRWYSNVVLTMFLKTLYIDLWTLLFVIPGLVKGYSYWMMEYILAENPTLERKRVFEISKQTMDGEKWNTFVLDISFILWGLLSGITCGIAGLLYVNPYADATKAQLYTVLREKAISQGIASQEELPG